MFESITDDYISKSLQLGYSIKDMNHKLSERVKNKKEKKTV